MAFIGITSNDTEIVVNNGGTLGGNAAFTFDDVTGGVTIASTDEANLTINSTGGTKIATLNLMRDSDPSLDFQLRNEGGLLYISNSADSGATWQNISSISGIDGVNVFSGSVDVATDIDPLTDLNDTADYHVVARRNTGTNGTGAGLAFSVTNNSTNVGAAIIHERTDSNSKGNLGFYTKQTTGAADDPVKALTINDDGSTDFTGHMTITTAEEPTLSLVASGGVKEPTIQFMRDSSPSADWRIQNRGGVFRFGKSLDDGATWDDTITFSTDGTAHTISANFTVDSLEIQGGTGVGIWAWTGAAFGQIGRFDTTGLTVVGEIKQSVHTDNVSTPPTAAELTAIFGTPASVGAGFQAIIDDNGADSILWKITSSGTSWFYLSLGVKAV